MYNRHLNTFVYVADHGSFSKAAEAMFVSPTAVTKQINLLEDRLGVKLFHRTYQGLSLTEAGKIVYTGAQKMIALSDDICGRARAAGTRSEAVVRIGTSQMNPVQLILSRWLEAATADPDIRLEVVPFHDTGDTFQKVLDSLGKDIDVFAGAYRNTAWGDSFGAFHLLDLPAQIILSRKHPLAGVDQLTLDDLLDKTLLVTPGDYDRLNGNCPGVHLKIVQYYDVTTFNQLADSNELLFGAAYWSDIHPQLVAVPVEWEYTIHYGLITAKEPSETVLHFISAIQNTVS